MRPTGQTLKRTVAGEEIATFVAYPLPPRNPVLNVNGEPAAPLRREAHVSRVASKPVKIIRQFQAALST
jgi:hypothetical protein